MIRNAFLAVAVALCATVSAQITSYSVNPANAAFSPIGADPSAINLGLGDDQAVTITLPFTFAWYTGNVTDIVVNSNGSVNMDGSTSAFFNLRNNTQTTPARIGVVQEDLAPNNGGGVFTLDTGSSFIVSWEGVPFFSATGSIDAQVELFANGEFEIRFGAITTGSTTNNFHSGPAGPGLSVSLQSVVPQFGATSQTSGGVAPQNTGARFAISITGPEFQPNSAESSLTVDGVQTSQICPGDFTFIDADTSLVGNPYELLINAAPIVAGSNGGSFTPNFQTYNISLAPGNLFLLNQGLGLGFFVPHPGAINFGFFGGGNFVGSAQQFVINPAQADFYSLSAAIQIDASAGTTSLSGTITGDDTNLALPIGANAFPGCLNSTIPFAGTSFTTFGVNANGHVFFTGTGGAFTPSVSTALSRALVGHWADFNQNLGGSIDYTFDTTNGLVVTWNGVPYFNDAATAQFLSVAIDMSGVATIDVSGLVARTAGTGTAFLGLSGGSVIGATDAGPTAFGIGSGANVAATDMLYDFADIAPAAPSGGILPSVTALQAGSGLLIFTPGLNPGEYSWTGL